MNSNVSVISRCFEKLAEMNVDMTASIYSAYLSAMPEVTEHIEYLDDRMKGRMLDQVYRLLLDDVDNDYLSFEARTHRCYGATVARYKGLLNAVKTTFKEQLGASWTAEDEQAWDASISRILTDIERVNLAA